MKFCTHGSAHTCTDSRKLTAVALCRSPRQTQKEPAFLYPEWGRCKCGGGEGGILSPLCFNLSGIQDIRRPHVACRVTQQMERGSHRLKDQRVGLCLGLFLYSKCPPPPPPGFWGWERVGLGRGYAGGNRAFVGHRSHLENDKESHHQQAFHWFPCRRQGEKVTAWQGQLFVRKEGLREGWGPCWELSSQAPGTSLAWNIRTRLCLEAPGWLPSLAGPHLLLVGSECMAAPAPHPLPGSSEHLVELESLPWPTLPLKAEFHLSRTPGFEWLLPPLVVWEARP